MTFLLGYLNRILPKKQFLHQPLPIKILNWPQIYTVGREEKDEVYSA